MHPVVLKYIRETNVEASAAEGETVLKRAIDEFGDVVLYPKANPAGRETTVADLALRKLREAPRLTVCSISLRQRSWSLAWDSGTGRHTSPRRAA
jgi:hypothetical protein